MREEGFPIGRSVIRNRRCHHLVVFCAFIGPNVEEAFAMSQVVFMLFFAGEKHAEIRPRVACRQISDLRGIGATRIQENEFPVLGPADVDGVKFVLLFVQRIGF